ncbi:MAG: hypothetical protein LBE09_03570 [Christensenellaceae bacterium]|nr:hypothetical protein [Christensenellaceae bacterium]
MVICSATSKIRVIETSNRLKGKIVAFVGTFSAGTIQVKDLVYAAAVLRLTTFLCLSIILLCVITKKCTNV